MPRGDIPCPAGRGCPRVPAGIAHVLTVAAAGPADGPFFPGYLIEVAVSDLGDAAAIR